MNFKAIFLIGILAFSFLAISFNSVSALNITVQNWDTGNSKIADEGTVKANFYDYAVSTTIKKGETGDICA